MLLRCMRVIRCSFSLLFLSYPLFPSWLVQATWPRYPGILGVEVTRSGQGSIYASCLVAGKDGMHVLVLGRSTLLVGGCLCYTVLMSVKIHLFLV
jgi:hypothetical protein